MAYTVSDLITIFRREVDDPSYYPDRNLPSPNTFWSNYELIQYLDQVQKEFAERTLVFKDSKTYAPDIEEDNPWVEFDPRILRIERAEIESTELIIPVKTIEEFQTSTYVDDYGTRRVSSWESNTGPAICLITDIEQDKGRLYPIPTEDDTLLLTVRRLPLNDLNELTDSLEVPERWQYGLLHGLRTQAYQSPKAMMAGFKDLYQLAYNNWENFLIEATSRINIRTRGPGKVRYGGI